MLQIKNQPSHPERGRKWSAEDFLILYRWVDQLVGSTLRAVAGSNRYGLLNPPTWVEGSAFDLKVVGRALELRRLFAVLPDGRFVVVYPPFSPALSCSVADLQEGAYEVMVKADQNARWPFIPPDEKPRSLQKCFLEFRSATEEAADQSDGFKIGRLLKSGASVELKRYLPAAFHLNGLTEQLWDRFQNYQEMTNNLYGFSTAIIRKTNASGANPVLANLHRLAWELARYMAQNRFAFRQLDPHSDPALLIAFYVGLAGTMNLFLSTSPQESELLDLFRRYVQDRVGYQELLRQGFRKAVRNLSDLTYDPDKLQDAVARLDRFFEEVYPVWEELGEASQILDSSEQDGILVRR